ncbi:MAG: transglycosylase SLT domain-containing protein [Acidobacteriota bacterium]
MLGNERFELGQVAHVFPSVGLEDRIEFWKNVYSKYGRRQVVFHDRESVSLIYRVKSFSDDPESSWAEYRRQEDWSDAQLKEIALRLKELAANLSLAKDSDDHEDLADAFKKAGIGLTPERLLRAADNVRAQRGIKEKFEAGVVRSGLYLAYIRQAFREEGVPEELAFLPHVESSFDYTAYSKVKAAGLWQFMPSTGRTYKLRVDSLVDERFDPIAATHAAARFLRDNHRALGSWPLALMAYNHGRNGMLRAKAVYGLDYLAITSNHQSPAFGFASRNFYSEYLAALLISSNHGHYFGNAVQVAEPLRFETMRLSRPVSLSIVTRMDGLSEGVLRAYNPQLRPAVFKKGVVPTGTLRVPRGMTTTLAAVLHNAPAAREPKAVVAKMSSKKKTPNRAASRYRVRSGDTLASIANKFRTTIAAVKRANGLRGSKVYIGQMLILR